MSTQGARDFLDKLANDETLCEKLFKKGGTKDELIEMLVAAGRDFQATL